MLEQFMRRHGITNVRINIAPSVTLNELVTTFLEPLYSGEIETRPFDDSNPEDVASKPSESQDILCEYDIFVAEIVDGKYTESRVSFRLDDLFSSPSVLLGT